MARRAVVVGGSIGGLFAGLLLRRIGWDVSIHERAGQELGGRGAGIVTHDALHETLALATGADEPIGVTLDERVVLGRDGAVVCAMRRPQVLASWDGIWRRLRNRADGIYRHGSALASLDPHDGHVLARFADGETIAADLVVAADGINSTVRRQLLPDAAPVFAGYIAWRGLVDAGVLSPGVRAQLLGRFGFCLPPGEQILGYPVDGPAGADLRYNWVWYRPADAERDLPRLLTGSDGRRHVDGIPPDRLHPEVLAQMHVAAGELLAPAFAEAVRLTRQPLLQAIVDRETSTMTVGRVALLGDAAFVARPHVGMGVTKAAGDAAALAGALASHADVDAALAAYDAERLLFGRRVVRRARNLGSYMQAQIRSGEERAQAERHRSPQAVMQETASMDGIAEW